MTDESELDDALDELDELTEEQLKQLEEENFDDRITSYNVCYTKLLRAVICRDHKTHGKGGAVLRQPILHSLQFFAKG